MERPSLPPHCADGLAIVLGRGARRNWAGPVKLAAGVAIAAAGQDRSAVCLHLARGAATGPLAGCVTSQPSGACCKRSRRPGWTDGPLPPSHVPVHWHLHMTHPALGRENGFSLPHVRLS